MPHSTCVPIDPSVFLKISTRRSSIGSSAAAHIVTLGGNKTSIIRSHKVDDRSHLLGASKPTHGNSAFHVFNLLRSNLLEDRRFDYRRGYTVDVNAEADNFFG